MENNETVENIIDNSISNVIDNTTENTIVEDNATNEQKLDLIHQDLSIIICFIVFFVLVILLKYAYKFFDMVFKF